MVSVIIPNYNHSKYLEQRIESVLNQMYEDYELIILDDCSLDNSRDIIENYRNHPKVSQIVYNKKNSGSTFKQWEKGISLAKGDYIWIAESDDWADSTFLEKIMDSIKKHGSSLCFSMSKVIDQNGNLKNLKLPILEGDSITTKAFLLNFLLYQNSIYNASMVVFKKGIVYDQVWKDVSKLKYCGDWLFWAEIISKANGTISEVKESLNNFRVHDLNVSGRSEYLGLTFLEGFPISLKITEKLNVKTSKKFSQEWFDKWYWYRHYFLFTKKVNFDILKMFLYRKPYVAFLEFKRLFLRTFNV